MEGIKRVIELPELLPVLPVRNTVLFPNAAVPLIVGRPRSVGAIRAAQRHGDLLLVVAQRDGGMEEPRHEDLYRVGVACLVSKITSVENDGFQLVANGLFRFRVHDYVDLEGYLSCRGVQVSDIAVPASTRIETLSTEIRQLGKSILSLASIPGSDALIKLFQQLQEPAQIADLCCTFLHLPMATKQELLETLELGRRLEMLLDLMMKEREKLGLQSEIQSKMMERLSKDQRDHLLREQLRTIHEELGEDGGVQEDFGKRVEEAGLSPEAKKVAKEELSRLNMVQRSSPEYHVIRTYLEWILSLPWKKSSGTEASQIDLDAARKILDEDHFGIDKVKNRIIEFLAVTKLKNDVKGPILCLVGPPGVGKTSVAKSIARSLGRHFVRTSLGGVRDEAEIRGHRRTYIGALPGRLIQNLKRAGVNDPLILLDEIDKIGSDFRGDPASALREVLDPEQNHAFLDHYLDVPFDLSRVFFITTANVLDTIPPALRDRLEVIEMTSYSKREKTFIAKRHLVPKILTDHGITAEQMTVPDETIELVIEGYTSEAGVRNLQRELSHLCRASAVELARVPPVLHVDVDPPRVDSILGPRRYFTEAINQQARPGIATGLAWTPVGGEILHIEITRIDGKGNLILTGQLGDVMKESAQIALTLARSQWNRPLSFRFDQSDFHIHVPSGAIPKDGPSAGVALLVALYSFLEGKTVSPKLAMTGEITLRGTVMPVGGVKEKVMAAHRAGIETICLPRHNEGDLRDVPLEVRNQLRFHFISDVNEVFRIAGLVEEPPTTPGPVLPPPPANHQLSFITN